MATWIFAAGVRERETKWCTRFVWSSQYDFITRWPFKNPTTAPTESESHTVSSVFTITVDIASVFVFFCFLTGASRCKTKLFFFVFIFVSFFQMVEKQQSCHECLQTYYSMLYKRGDFVWEKMEKKQKTKSKLWSSTMLNTSFKRLNNVTAPSDCKWHFCQMTRDLLIAVGTKTRNIHTNTARP